MGQSRREHLRVLGPFTARRAGILPVPMHIHDLSVGGCLVQCFHEEPVGRRISFHIELPNEGWVPLHAEVIYTRPDYGFAVKFVGLPAKTRAILERVIDRILTKSPSED